MARSSTFTSYVRSELDPSTGTAYRQLESIANRTYDSIAKRAAAASNAGSQLGGGGFSGGAAAQAAARAFDATAAAQSRAASAANDNAASQRVHSTALREAQAASAGLETNLKTLSTTLNVVQGPLGPLAGRVRSVSAAMTELTGLRFGLAAVGASLFVFGRVANEYTNVQNRLRPLFDDQKKFNEAFNDVIGIATRSRQALAPIADLYQRITIAGQDAGLSQARIGRITEIAAKSATISGGPADVQQRGLVQFSQGLGRGVLQGQDLKALEEDIPYLGKVIAAGFKNADGSIGTTFSNLKKLGAEGKLTGEAVADALERAQTKMVDIPFSKLALTPAAGLTRVETALAQVVGNINEATGATSKLGNSLGFVADHMRTLIALGVGLAGAFVAPKVLSYLGSVATSLDAAITRGEQLRAIVAGTGNVTPINAPEPVRALGAARNAADDANAVNQEAQVAVAATRAKIAALEEEGAAYRSNIAIVRQQLAAAEAAAAEQVVGANAATEAIIAEARQRGLLVAEIQEEAAASRKATADQLADAEARVAALRVEAEQMATNQALIDKQAAAAASAKATRANLDAQGLSYVGVGAKDQAALESSVSTGRAQVLMRQQQTGVAGELAAAERALAAARIEEAAAADRQAAADAAAAVSQGSDEIVRQSTILTTYRQRERAVTAELGEINTLLAQQYGVAKVAAGEAAAATAAVTVAERAAAVATGLFGGALNLLKASVPFLVISALVTAVTYLASAESKAAEGARELAEAQQNMGKFVDTTTGKIIEQNKAILAGELVKARGTVNTNREAFAGARDAFRSTAVGQVTVAGGQFGGSRTIATGVPAYITKLVNDVADNVKGSAAKLDTALTAFEKTGANAAGLAARIRTAEAAAVGVLRNTQASEAYVQELSGKGTPAIARLAGGTFNQPGTKPREIPAALTAAQSKALADAAAANSDLQRAIAAREKVVADGAAARTAGTFDEKAYTEQLTAATIAVNQAREAQKALNAARRQSSKDANQAKRNESDVARDAAQEARDAATRQLDQAQQDLEGRRPGISRQEYLDQRVSNLQAYDDAVNKANQALAEELTRINGNRSASGKQAAESHKAADQQVADAKEVGAAQREINTSFERDVANLQLKLQGRENEAAALGQTLTLVERIGNAGFAEYQTLLQQNRVEELLNGKLAERQRITSTLQQGVENVRQSLAAFLQDVSGNAPQAVANLGKNLLAGFQKGMAELAADQLLDGADQKIKDLISGKSRVESATDFAAVQFSRTGQAALNLSSAFETARNFVLRLVGTTPPAAGTSPNVGTTGVPQPAGFEALPLTAGGNLSSLLKPDLSTGGIIAAVAGLTGATKMLGKTVDAVATGPAPIQEPVLTGSLEKALSSVVTGSGVAITGANDNGAPTVNGDVVVTANPLRAAPPIQEPVIGGPILPALASLTNAQAKLANSQPPSLREIYNETGRSIGEKLDTTLGTKFLGKLGGKLGDVLGGAGKGTLASSLASAIGIKQNATGAAIGGALGSFIPIPGASFVTGIVGGLIGNLFGGGKIGGASFTSAGVGSSFGNDSASTKAGVSAVNQAFSSLQNVADQLHGTLGNFGTITVGEYKGKYRVNDHGTNLKSNNDVEEFATLEEAQAFALRQAILKGGITGIGQTAQNLIRKYADDINTGLQKALLVNNIPRQLLAYTDPVKAAVLNLNDSFDTIIKTLIEGGATAQEYADAQKLYEFQRADAIKQATQQASTAIDDFLADLNNSTQSPLNKKTAYDNATAALANFKTDIEAGKQVDETELLTAAKNFNDTSRALKGSGSGYFDDFNMLNTLLNKAKANEGSVATSTDLPDSPFVTNGTAAAALSTITNAQVNATNKQTTVLSDQLDGVISAIQDLGAYSGATYYPANDSSLGLLPGFKTG